MIHQRLAWCRPRRITGLMLGASLTTLVGCAAPRAVGHSGQGEEYTRYVLSLYNEPTANHGARSIEFPVHVAMAQVGDASPSPAVVDKLRKAPEVFERVDALPDSGSGGPGSAQGRDPVRRLQDLARDQGADYLLIYGATVDQRTVVSPLSVLDLTIVGAFIVPSRELATTARGSAALIDTRTGNIVMTAGAESNGRRYTSAFSSDSEVAKLADQVQQESILKLADQLIVDARRRNADDALPPLSASK